PGDYAIHFEAGYFSSRRRHTSWPRDWSSDVCSSDLAWVKFPGQPAGRQVFFYSNGPGGAISFSVNTDRTVFVTTLGIADVRSQRSEERRVGKECRSGGSQ